MRIAGADLLLRPPDWRRGPDGMQPQDWPVWHAWQRLHLGDYNAFSFNARLPTRAPPPLDLADPTARAFIDSLAKRIDVVGRRPGGQADLLEVATSPSLSALGQLLVYDDLWRRHADTPRGTLILVCAELDPDLAAVLPTYAIRADVVHPAAPAP